MDMTSHLLAALNLPPIRDFPMVSDPNTRDRPLPLEPSTSQDAYGSAQYQQGRRDPNQKSQAQTPLQQSTHLQFHSLESGDGSRLESRQDIADSAPKPQASGPTETPPGGSEMPRETRATNDCQDQQHASSSNSPPYSELPPSDPLAQNEQAKKKSSGNPGQQDKPRRARRKWTEAETNDLIRGCHIHGIGNWKKVLEDERFHFNDRSSVDLKDRFRTCFPKEYKKGSGHEAPAPRHPPDLNGAVALGPPALAPAPPAALEPSPQPRGSKSSGGGERSRKRTTKTEVQHVEVLESLGLTDFSRVQRRHRREFTAEEDARLLEGFNTHGAAWSKIQSDPELHLGHRRGTDLRDRFRNAFPDRYESAGFKARPRNRPHPPRSSPDDLSKVEADDATGGFMHQISEDRHGMDLEEQKLENPSLLMHSLLSEHLSPSWATGGPPIDPADQPSAAGSLALDPALNDGFPGTTLEQITEEFLSNGKSPHGHGENLPQNHVSNIPQNHRHDLTQSNGHDLSHDMVRWEEMANNPIFDLDSMTPCPPDQIEMPMKAPSEIPPPHRSVTHNPFIMEDGSVKKGNTKRAPKGSGMGKANTPKKRRTSKQTVQ